MKHKWTYFLDVSSTRTGVVLLRDDKKHIIVTDLDFSKCKKNKDITKIENQILKFKYIKNLLDEFTKKYPPNDEIYMEGIFVNPQRLNSSEVLLKLHGFLILYFIDNTFHYYPPSNIKKLLTGKGNSSKELVKEKILEKYPIGFKNEDQSDAFGVFCYYMFEEGYEIKEKIKIECI